MPPEMTQFVSGPPDLSLVELAVYGVAGMGLVLFLLTLLAVVTLPLFFGALGVMELALKLVQNLPDPVGKSAKLTGLVFRSLRRNLLRTALTYVALFVLTGMLTMIYSAVSLLANITKEKEGNVKVLLTEKYSIPSLMPPGYSGQLKGIIRDRLPPESRMPDIDANFMTWAFVGTSLDPEKRTAENNLTFFCLEPDAVLTMMDDQGLNKTDLGDDGYAALIAGIELVKQDKRNIIVGEDRLKTIGKQVGDEVKCYGSNYKDITFECKIVAAFPSGSRMANNACMRSDYLAAKLDEYEKTKGKPHPVAAGCVNLIWVRLPDKASYERLASIVNEPGVFGSPAVKLETFSSGVAAFIEPFKDILWGMKYLIMPAITVIMCLVVGITITIGVRERWTEMAVLKVLGFQPWQVMAMIIAEAVLIGLFGSLLSTWLVTLLPEFIEWAKATFGIKFQAAFFNTFKAPIEVAYLGPLLGGLVGLIGAAVPSQSARRVKVSEVFAQVA